MEQMDHWGGRILSGFCLEIASNQKSLPLNSGSNVSSMTWFTIVKSSWEPRLIQVNNLTVVASTTVPTISTNVALTSCVCGGGGSNTFILPPSAASIFTYVSSSAKLRTFPVSLIGCDAPMKSLIRAELTRGDMDSVDISNCYEPCVWDGDADNGTGTVYKYKG